MLKQLRLESLSLKNFKGIKQFTLDTKGGNPSIFGDNGTGKTTLFDGELWVLFDKDSQNKKDFSIKTLDSSGNELHGLEHEVEAVFWFNSKRIVFRKVYKEKWTKKRGSAQAEFTGHTTDYFLDGVPVKKNEYVKQIESIVQEDVFKLLTSPTYFNEQLKWQDRRKTLLEIAGDISDEDVIASDKSLANLPTILQGRSIENHRKVIASRRSEINKELEKIPVRIDEIQRSLPDLNGLNKKALEAEIGTLNDEIDEKMTQISNIKNGKAISDKQIAIQKIESELLEIKRAHDSDSKDKVYSLKARIQEEKSNVSILSSKLENLKTRKKYNNDSVTKIDSQLQRLRDDWREINSKEFVHEDQCACPVCGQSLPPEKIEATRKEALSQFNLKRSRLLEDINDRGKTGSSRKKELLQENEKLSIEYEKLNGQIADKQKILAKLQEELTQLEDIMIDITENPAYVAKLKQKQAIEDEIKQIREMTDQSIQDIQLEIIKLKQKRDHLQGEVGKFVLVDQSNKRIEELSQQERTLAAEYEKLEQELYLTEEFIRTKVNLLEDKINSKFKYARFKLFDTQVNGGLQEVCETTYNGVPYGTGLNNAARINVGLDIINTLSNFYGFSAPIFIDNREAVTKLIDTNAQTISLVVSEKDKQLRVETDPVEYKEAI